MNTCATRLRSSLSYSRKGGILTIHRSAMVSPAGLYSASQNLIAGGLGGARFSRRRGDAPRPVLP
jgi:hypothetical protein